MRKAAALALLLIGLTACKPSEEGGTGGTYESIVVDTDRGEAVCVIWDGHQAGALDCTWEGTR